MTDTVATAQPWYRALNRHQWNILLAANLGWLFDGFELYALFLTVGPTSRTRLDPAQSPRIPAYIGTVVAITLLGWGIGGIVGGVLADYIGRKRTMILAILAYSVTTGLTAISFDWISFAVLRFLVGIAIGSEWATGSSMMAELWPDHARGRGAGLMQCGIGIGNFVASFVWLYVGALGPDSWRYLFLIGILPALLTLWIRTSIPESGKWEHTNARRKAPADRHALFRHGVPHDPGPLPVDGGPRALVACGRHQRVLHLGAVFVDAGVAAGIVSHPLARHRHRLRLQCAAFHRLSRPAVRRHADRAVRRLRQGGDDFRLHLCPRIFRRALPAGDEGKAVARERVISSAELRLPGTLLARLL